MRCQELFHSRFSRFFISYKNILDVHMISAERLADLSREFDLLSSVRFSFDLLQVLLHDLLHDRVVHEI